MRAGQRFQIYLICMLLSACASSAGPGATPAAAPTVQPSPTLAPSATLRPALPTSTQQPTASPLPTAVPTPTAIPTPTAAPMPTTPAIDASCIPADATVPAPLVSNPAPTFDRPALERTSLPIYGYKIVASYPHNRDSWTEGLVIEDGFLYEGTGTEKGPATLRRLDLESGAVLQGCVLPSQFYGEGVTIFGKQLYQLTWRSNAGFIYDKDSFAFQRAFSYPSEGWGLTHDDTRLIMSDGTSTIHFLDPATLQETGRIEVRDDQGAVGRLNELEYIGGEIYANIWLTDLIARIDPRSGQVLAWIDLSGLLSAEDRAGGADVLNGIAYDAARDRLLVTGKLWPKLFEITLVKK